MEQSGPRKKRINTLFLDIIKEFIIDTCSIVLWTYCLIVILVIVGSLFQTSNEQIKIISYIFNVKTIDVINIYGTAKLFLIIIVVAMSVSLVINNKGEE